MCRSSSAIKWGKNDFVIKSITRSWLKPCSFYCLPREGGKPLVPEWYFGQASSISKPPVGVIIAAWNCRCWKVIRSHMVSLSPMTLMSRISHLTTRKIKQDRYNRTGLSVPIWMMSLYLDFFYVFLFIYFFIWSSKSCFKGKQIAVDLSWLSYLCSLFGEKNCLNKYFSSEPLGIKSICFQKQERASFYPFAKGP